MSEVPVVVSDESNTLINLHDVNSRPWQISLCQSG
jgi:hypothetical protein